jgi:pimeloyl-ACP methyl ester carboxylesterase
LPGMNGKTSLYAKQRAAFPRLQTPEWIPPKTGELLPDYATRMGESLDISSNCLLGGTSFGGMVAQEMTASLGLIECWIISSVRSREELPPWWQMLLPYALDGEQALAEFMVAMANNPPPDLSREIAARWRRLNHPDAHFLRWAVWAVLTWEKTPAANTLTTYHLHGDSDTTFPIEYVHPNVTVADGGHVLPLTHDAVVNAFLPH